MRERVWNTAGVKLSEQLPLWERVSSEAFVPVRVRGSTSHTGFSSSVAARAFGGVSVARIETPPQRVIRHEELVAVDPGAMFFVNLPLTAGTSAQQSGRRAHLAPRDFVVVDSEAPFELVFSRPLRQISLCVPHELLAPRLRRVEAATAVRVDGSNGIGAVASQMAQRLATVPGSIDARAARALGLQMMDLMALALGTVAPAYARRAPELILEAVYAEAERSLGDPLLSPTLVADRVGVSVRYLHRLFAQQGTSFGRWVTRRRLERCYADLTDAGLVGHSISQICLDHGFADPSYFARAFRSAYGESPSQVRRSVLQARG